MVEVKVSIHSRNYDSYIVSLKDWKVPSSVVQDINSFCSQSLLGQVHKGFKISTARLLKVLSLLKIPLQFWNKSLGSLTLLDVEKFEKALTSDKLKSYKKLPYSDSTKSDIRKILRLFLRWKLKDRASKLVDWLDVRVPVKTPSYLSEVEVDKLYKSCSTARNRFVIAVLFDTGARAEEFCNIRLEDVQIPTGSDNFVKIALKEEYSKTKGRTISLYWKYSLEAIRDFLEERRKAGASLSEPLFNDSYEALRGILKRLGTKVLGKSLHAHLFRHSSATYYAVKLNRYELCYRFGWAFSSNMPDVYISRAGMESRPLDEKFKATELEELRLRLQKTESLLSRVVEASGLALDSAKNFILKRC